MLRWLVVTSHRNIVSQVEKSRRRSCNMSSLAKLAKQKYDYFLVLDLEATCERERAPRPQEIIEFPVLKVSGHTFEIESIFHEYVRPKAHPVLSSFCTELTGIIQDMVDGQPVFEDVLQMFVTWMREQRLLSSQFIFVTFGDWDLLKMLPSQCAYSGVPVPEYMKTWVNLKKSFSEATGHWPKTLPQTMEYCGMETIGRHHSGIDDCRNNAAILKWLAQQGYVFSATGSTLPS
ncbi:ERI1 exoribonuclease 3-like isoform X2 [Ornithodoros turicata]